MIRGWWGRRASRSHLSDETILMHLDGGLTPREDERAAQHLRDCWECRTRKGRLEAAIAAFMDERQDALDIGAWPVSNVERFVARLKTNSRTSTTSSFRAWLSPLRGLRRAWWPLAAAAVGWAAVGVWTPVQEYVLERAVEKAQIEQLGLRIPAVPPMTFEEFPLRRDPLVAAPLVREAPPAVEPSVQPKLNLDFVELETHLAVHELGLARTGAVDVHRLPGEAIVVTGVIDDPERARLLRERLAAVGPVQFQIKTTDEEVSLPTSATSAEVIEPRPPLIEDVLREYFRRHAPKDRAGVEMSEYANSVLRLTSVVYGEARSLRVLASVFPASRVQATTPGQRERLRLIAAAHLEELRNATVRLRLLLDRIDPIAAGGSEIGPVSHLSGADWPVQLERTASTLEYLAGGLFAGLSMGNMDAATAWSGMMRSCRTLEHWLQEEAALTAAAWLSGGLESAKTVDPKSR